MSCENFIKQSFPDLPEEDIKEIVDTIKRLRPNFRTREEYVRYVKDYILRQKGHVSRDAAIRLHTAELFRDNIDYINHPMWKGDYRQAVLSKLEQTSSNIPNSGLSVEALKSSKHKIYNMILRGPLTEQGLMDAFTSSEFDSHIMNHMMGTPTHPKELTPIVEGIASHLEHFYDSVLKDLNSSGFLTAKRQGYFGPIIHDGDKINGNFEEWAKDIVNHYDLNKSFPYVSDAERVLFKNNIDNLELLKDNQMYKELYEDYTRIAKDYSYFSGDPDLFVFKKEGGIVEQRAKGRSYVPKNGNSLKAYLDKWGRYNTLSSMADFYGSRAARDYALVQNFGANVNYGKDLLLTYLKKKDPDNFNSIKRQFDISWDLVTGNTGYTPTFATKIGDFTKSTTTMANLGTSFVTQVLDVSSSFIHYNVNTRKTFPVAFKDTLHTYLGSIPEAFRKDVAQDIYMYASDMAKSAHSELLKESGNALGMYSKVADSMLKMTGTPFMNRLSFITNAKLYSRHLKDLAFKDSLHPRDTLLLNKFGITHEDLKFLKPFFDKRGDTPIQHALLKEENLDYFLKNKNPKNLPAKIYLQNINTNLTAYMSEMSYKGSPIGGIRESRYLGQVRKDAPFGIGVAVEAGLQFKRTATKQFVDALVGLDRIIKDAPSSKGVPAQFESMYTLGKWGLVTTGFGMLVYLTKDYMRNGDESIAANIEPDSWSDPAFTLNLAKNGFFIGGAPYLFGDVLYNIDRPNLIKAGFWTPQMNQLLRMSTIPFNVGDDFLEQGELSDKTIKEIKAFGMEMVPMKNHPAMQPFIKGFVDGQKDI